MVSNKRRNFFLLLITHHFFVPVAAADEMNDLDGVAFGQSGLLPVGAADYFPVTFDGETFWNERELPDEVGERRIRPDLAALSVDFDAQGIYQPLSGRMMRRISAS